MIDGVVARFRLRQDETSEEEVDVYDTDTEMIFDYGNAFLAGFKYQETLPSAMQCSKYLEQSILTYNTTYERWQQEEIANQTTTQDYIFNTTEWISYNLAPSSSNCFKTGLEAFSWGLAKES